MRTRSTLTWLGLATGLLAGCRAVLGIEDPPPEDGDDSSSGSGFVTTGTGEAQGSTGTASGSGGAPATSTGVGLSGSTSTDVSSASSTSTGAGGEPQPTLEVSLAAPGLRLAYDMNGDSLYVLDDQGAVSRFPADLSLHERCTGFVPGVDIFAPGTLAAGNGQVAHAVDDEQVAFLQYPDGCTYPSRCACVVVPRPIPARGVHARDQFFYAADASTAGFGPFGFGTSMFAGVDQPPGGFTGPQAVALGVSHAFVAGSATGGAAVAKFEVGGASPPETIGAVGMGKFLAVAVSPDEQAVFVWQMLDDQSSQVVDLAGTFLDAPPYAGTPSLAADHRNVFIPTDGGFRVCAFGGGCSPYRSGSGRVGDVLALPSLGVLFVLQDASVLRYDLDGF